MNFLDLIKQVAAKPEEKEEELIEKEVIEKEEKKELENQLKSLPSAILSSSILMKSSIQRQCRRKTYLSSIVSNKTVVISKLTDEDIYVIFKNNTRPVSDNQYLVTYLSNLHPFYDSIVEARGDKAIEILKNISFMLKFYSESKDKIVFRTGERDERCFIILEGQVDIISPNEEYIKMTDEEYVRYLIKLRTVNEIDMLKEVIDANNDTFAIEERSFDYWIRIAYRTIHALKDKRQTRKNESQDIVNRKKTITRRKSQPSVITKTFETRKLKSLVLNLETEIINLYNQLELDSFNNNIANEPKVHNITSIEFIQRIKPIYSETSSFLLDLEKSTYKIKTYFISQTVSKGEIFGEVLTDGIHTKVFENTKRTSTAITTQDIKCAYLKKDAFYDLLRLTLEKLKRDKISFLFDLGIFSKANKAFFIKNFSNCIKKKIISDQTILFEENDSIGKDYFVYFIQSGQFQASCFKSIHDINQVLNEKSHEISNDQFEKEYLRKKSFKLAIFGANDVIGLGDSIHQGKYLFTLKCISVKGVIYELHYEFFQSLMMADNSVKIRTEELQLVKIGIRNKLLKQQKEVRLQFLYNRILKSQKETKPPTILKLKLPIPTRSFYRKLNKQNYDIDNALRDEVSSTRPQIRKNTTTCHRSLTSRNNTKKRKIEQKSSYSIRQDKTSIDKVDRIKKELIKQKTQIIKLDISNSITNANINSNSNTIYQTRKTLTNDNDSFIYLATETNCNNDHNQKNIICKREASQINPLAYDDFERHYNTEYYFNVYGDALRKKIEQYYLRLTDSKHIPSKRELSLKQTSLYKTISSFKTSSSLKKPTTSNFNHCKQIKLYNHKH